MFILFSILLSVADKMSINSKYHLLTKNDFVGIVKPLKLGLLD